MKAFFTMSFLTLISICGIFKCESSLQFGRYRYPASFYDLANHNNKQLGEYKWTEEWYEQMPIDHFDFADTRTFRLRYLLNTDHFAKKNGPIFFYTGNEGPIEGFALNTGFMWDIAEQFGAAIIFAEHRFYGKSMPFGNDSYRTVANLGYLGSEQALGDFAQLITYLKNEKLANAKNSPVIAFGGSYGAMLTAWIRIKYSHLVDGALASSAPVYGFQNAPKPAEDIYDRVVTRTFQSSGCNATSVTSSFESIRELTKTDSGRAFLNAKFHLDNASLVRSSADGEALVGAVKDVMETMAMIDYPYPANFLALLPAWPVKVVCSNFPSSLTNKSSEVKALAVYELFNIYYNYTGQLGKMCLFGDGCPGPFGVLGSPEGWPWQECTEMIMPQCSSSLPNDYFPKSCPYSMEVSAENCVKRFGKIGFRKELFRKDWAVINYGLAKFPAASNIIFSNGELDPCSGDGWRLVPYTQGSLVSLIIPNAAHHYDLRPVHPDDTAEVKEARRVEIEHIKRWIAQAKRGARSAKRKHRARLHRLRRIRI